eukprot:1057899-Pyramimonas_sp.AAC.1
MTFLANVAGRIWSGLESYVLRPSETKRLDRSIAKKLRAMLRGQAHSVDSAGRHHSSTTRQ